MMLGDAPRPAEVNAEWDAATVSEGLKVLFLIENNFSDTSTLKV